MTDINVLITSCGRRVELVKAFMRARTKLNIVGKVIVADMQSSAPAMYFGDKNYIIPRISSDNFIPAIIKICKDENISLIVPTIDTELQKLADNKALIESSTRAKVMISDSKVIAICNDKIKTAKFFLDNGFGVPKTLNSDDIIAKNYSFPLFIKPLDGSSSVNAFKVNNEKELVFFLEYINNPIVQECVSGKEYTIDAFVDFAGNIITIVPRIRLATRSGEVLKGLVDKNRLIIDDVTRLIHTLHPIGHITIQGFLGEDNIFRYIEINPRFGGGAPMSIIAGADSPANLYRLLRGEKLSYDENYRDKVLISRFDDSVEVNID